MTGSTTPPGIDHGVGPGAEPTVEPAVGPVVAPNVNPGVHPDVDVAYWARVERGGTWALTRSFDFPDWKTALAFVVAVGAIADAEDHHPLVELAWGRVTLFCWTHDTGGIGPQDVALCEAINALAPSSG